MLQGENTYHVSTYLRACSFVRWISIGDRCYDWIPIANCNRVVFSRSILGTWVVFSFVVVKVLVLLQP